MSEHLYAALWLFLDKFLLLVYRVVKNPALKRTQPSGFLGVLVIFWGFRVFLGFFFVNFWFLGKLLCSSK
jgi:hypothetical protein